jgi:preprotein translocase subunit Sec61beta
MSEREKQYMPQSTAGLIRYFDVEQGLKIRPEHVVYVSAAFAAIVLIMKFLV